MIQEQDSMRFGLSSAHPSADGVDREFYITMKVAETSKLGSVVGSMVGKTVEAAGLRSVPGVVLFAIQRPAVETFRAVGPDFVLQSHDVLWFSGERDGVTALRRLPGLVDVDTKQLEKLQIAAHQRRLVEIVLSLRSDMLYKSIREARFRSRFSAAIVAVHRQGAPIISTIGDVVLQPGDVLILDAGPNFVVQYRDDPNFLLVAELDGSAPPRFDKFYIAFFTTAWMIGLSAGLESYGINLVLLALWASAIMLVTACLSPERAFKSLNWGVIITVACAFGLSTALEKTKVAAIFGNALVSLAELTNTGEIGVLCTVMIATALLSSLVANNAAALLMFPIAAQAAAGAGISPNKMLYALMFGASDYATPFGYQTNLMVYGPGGYVFLDYLKFGGPFMVYLLVVQTVVLGTLDMWYLTWIASSALLIVCAILDLTLRGGMRFRDVIGLLKCTRTPKE
jgi:K+/H+ antiporter YhaU regulatory subunit KhtT